MTKLSFKPYRRKLKQAIKMSRGLIEHREGIILRYAAERVAFAEVLILDYFGTESIKRSVEILSSLPAEISLETLDIIPDDCFATRLAIESLFVIPEVKRDMNVSKLLPAGLAAISEFKLGLAQGYKTFKWKIGSYENEFEIFDELSSFAGEVFFRLDANAGLSIEQARKWLEYSKDKQVEFIEQPLVPELFAETLKLSKEFSTPIALDESVAKTEDLIAAHDRGWDGLFVVKPSRLGKLREFIAWREKTKPKIVYSSALETSFGTEMGMRLAASDRINNYAVGYGVHHFFEDDGFDIHQKSPHMIVGNISSAKFEQLWQKISSR